MAAPVAFDVTIPLNLPSRPVWDALIDWRGHADWIPMTRVEIEHEEPGGGIGTIFTAWTGIGPLSLEDRMEVTEVRWDDETKEGFCEVQKLGPVLDGRAAFQVRPGATPDHSEVIWTEEVTVKYLPNALAKPVGKVSAQGFRLAVSRLPKAIERSGEPAP